MWMNCIGCPLSLKSGKEMPSSVYFQWTIWIIVTDFVKKVKLIKDDKKPSILMVGNKCDIVGRRRVTSTRSKAKAQS